MVNTNKILTVSYGTFSCTLEGFDDSFGTMKAIAEYFRDLAADDRYFGAEPPAPDAEMLARIAEREIARRVEAKVDNENIHLRADPGSILPVAARIAESVETQETPVEQAAPVEPVAEPLVKSEVEPTKVEPPAEPVQEHPVKAPVEVKPQPEPQPEAITPEPEPEQPVAVEPVVTEDAGEEDTIDGLDEILAQPTDVEPPQPEPELAAQPDPAEFFAASPNDMPAEADSVAAKLQRIRAVVDQDDEAEQGTDYTEDEHAEDFLAGAHEDIEAALALDDQAEEQRAEWDAENEDEDESDEIAALLNRFGVDDDDGDHGEEDYFADAPDVEPDVQTNPEPAPEPNPAPTQVRARVIKMKRADFEAAIASGELEEQDTSDTTEDTTGGLSPEDEADLMRELAAVEAELPDDAPEQAAPIDQTDALLSDILAEDAASAQEEQQAPAATPIDLSAFSTDEDDDDDEDLGIDSIFAEADDDEIDQTPQETGTRFQDDSDMNRMFDKAATEMDEETGKDRRNAIAHLRAAVAAAKAEEGAGGNLKSHAPDTEVYRDDLDSVVRPRHPGATRAHTERPSAQRPAPLKLVAEQRVDLDETAAAHPVRPRRVALRKSEQPIGNAGDFADYAEDMGAHTLPELLEAAAAYLSFVEGREQFSRPQLMTQVRQVDPEDFSREDGLRSFGQLLREGKIEKLEGGRFKASESISYRPDARNVG